jgi:hypothetical protein
MNALDARQLQRAHAAEGRFGAVLFAGLEEQRQVAPAAVAFSILKVNIVRREGPLRIELQVASTNLQGIVGAGLARRTENGEFARQPAAQQTAKFRAGQIERFVELQNRTLRRAENNRPTFALLFPVRILLGSCVKDERRRFQFQPAIGGRLIILQQQCALLGFDSFRALTLPGVFGEEVDDVIGPRRGRWWRWVCSSASNSSNYRRRFEQRRNEPRVAGISHYERASRE